MCVCVYKCMIIDALNTYSHSFNVAKAFNTPETSICTIGKNGTHIPRVLTKVLHPPKQLINHQKFGVTLC